MTAYSCRNDYLKDLEGRAALPAGFAVSTAALKFSPREIEGSARMNLTLIDLPPIFVPPLMTVPRAHGYPPFSGHI
jgi:hypothetical protein